MSNAGVLAWAGVEISFQRIGRGAWSPNGLLRSWSFAPWRTVPGGVTIACFPAEALWLGLSNAGAPATVRIESQNGRWSREVVVPPDWQLSWIGRDIQKKPIALNQGCHTARFRLRAQGPTKELSTTLGLTLLAPDAWKKRFGRIELEPAIEPAPVMRYSRVMPIEGDAPDAGDKNLFSTSNGNR
jgi:hypothetical protein